MSNHTQTVYDLRGYQTKASDSILSDLSDVDSALLVAATGSGKTVIYSEVVRRYLAEHGGRALVLAPQFRLLEQGRKALNDFAGFGIGSIGYESGDHHLNPRHIPKIVLSTLDTMRNRLDKFDPDTFRIMIIDEADYATPGTWTIRKYFDSAKALGVTATTKRTDNLKLLGSGCYDTISDVIEIRDLIEEGYLVPIQQNFVDTATINLEGVKVTAKGDFKEDELDAIMIQEQSVLEVAQIAINESGTRPTLIFCSSVEHSERVASSINNHLPGYAASVSGADKDQEYNIGRFKRGDIQYLCNCMLLTRGADMPHVSHLVMARPTKSTSLYTQMVGRGTRLLGRDYVESMANGKTDLLVTDIVGVSHQHKLTTVIDILSPGSSPESIEEAIRNARKNGSRSAVDIAKDAERLTAEAEARAKLKAKGAQYTKTAVDPFAVMGIRKPVAYGLPMTEGQERALRNFKVPEDVLSTLDKRQAGKLIQSLIEGINKGSATLKQKTLLRKYGLLKDGEDISFDAAGDVITIISRNNWRLQGVEFEVHAAMSEQV